MRKWEKVRKNLEKRMPTLEQRLEKQEEHNKKVAHLESRIVKMEKPNQEFGDGQSGNKKRLRLKKIKRILQRKERD